MKRFPSISDGPVVCVFEAIDWWSKRRWRLRNFTLAIVCAMFALVSFAGTVELHLSEYAGMVVYPTVALLWLLSVIIIVPELLGDANAHKGMNPLREFVWVRLVAIGAYLVAVLPMYAWTASSLAAKIDTIGGFFFVSTFYFLSCDLTPDARKSWDLAQ